MAREDLLAKLQDIFVDVFDDEAIAITEDSSADDIEEWDSFMHISILAAVQTEFDIKFGVEEIAAMKNIHDMLDAIEGKL